jgi:hypothetical protein
VRIPRCFADFGVGQLDVGIWSFAAILEAISLNGMPISSTPWYLAPASPFSRESRKSLAASRRCTAGQRLAFLSRLRTPDDYSKKPDEALVLFCGRFLEKLLWEGAIRMCRVCVAEAERFPDESAQYCYVIFTEVETRLAAYLRLKFALSPRAGSEAAQTLLGQVLHPRFPRALFGVDPLVKSFDEDHLSPEFDLKPIRKAVSELLDSIDEKSRRK